MKPPEIAVGEAFMYAEGVTRGDYMFPTRHFSILVSGKDDPIIYDVDEDVCFLPVKGWEEDTSGVVGEISPQTMIRALATLAKCREDHSLFQYPCWNY